MYVDVAHIETGIGTGVKSRCFIQKYIRVQCGQEETNLNSLHATSESESNYMKIIRV